MPYGADNGLRKRTTIRKCQVCILPEEQKDALERAMRGGRQVGGGILTVQAVMRKWNIVVSQPLVSRHKKECLGLYSPRMKGPPPETSTALTVPPPTETALADVAAWVPTDVRDWTRAKIKAAIAELDVKCQGVGTAAFFQVRLEHFKLLLAESEKTGGSPIDRQKSYEDVVGAKLAEKGRREIKRTVTMTETITQDMEGNAEPTGPAITVLSPADSLRPAGLDAISSADPAVN